MYWEDEICENRHPGTLFFDGTVSKKLSGNVKGLPGMLRFERTCNIANQFLPAKADSPMR